ncbi:YdeI/OmpD-associated family protein [Aureitalea sp. L0-47]|uniref:YdeI/OmpD-associated family protein n=1 Tax=Aureitalea sp. L0-47 TaxID=2816962 RepID=UPI0022381DE7|nr:DUF1801 domain-containing protein [Aureitalea sp. L0-47]MCW5519781.1 YdeI/OmpD-associated family protein [Aureitalea sp. L0-47]
MNVSEKVSAYIEKHHRWSSQLQQLREVFQQSDLVENVKWGSPTYTMNGKLVAGFAAFKHHFAIWFHQGVFLKDPDKNLINAQEGKTKALRQWKFTEGDIIEKDIVLKYIREATENSLAGKEVKPKKKKSVTIPELLNRALEKDTAFKEAFEGLTPGRQREYSEHVGSAKREATQLSRLEKIKPMILQGVGLNDKYKNC